MLWNNQSSNTIISRSNLTSHVHRTMLLMKIHKAEDGVVEEAEGVVGATGVDVEIIKIMVGMSTGGYLEIIKIMEGIQGEMDTEIIEIMAGIQTGEMDMEIIKIMVGIQTGEMDMKIIKIMVSIQTGARIKITVVGIRIMVAVVGEPGAPVEADMKEAPEVEEEVIIVVAVVATIGVVVVVVITRLRWDD